MGTSERVALLCLYSWCLVVAMWLLLMMPQVCLQFVVVVFPVQAHLLFVYNMQTPNTRVTKDLLLYLTTALASATITIYHHRFTYLSWDPA